MNALDSPLEALAFNYVNLGIFAVVNNLWTWIAVVTAAVSFWRIRTIGGAPTCSVKSDRRSACVDRIALKAKPESSHLDNSTDDHEPQATPAPVDGTAESMKETAALVVKAAATSPLLCNDGMTRGKFTTYYGAVDGERGDGELTASDEGGFGEAAGCGEWWERWERVMRARDGDDGWYRYVDLSVINGNVVRLWDGNGMDPSNGGKDGRVRRKQSCFG